MKKGEKIEREVPHYLVVGECPWLQSWFEDCDHIVIDTADLDLSTVSFTYGDSHPTFSDRVNDGKKNGFKVISCEGNGDDSGFEPDSVRRWIKYEI